MIQDTIRKVISMQDLDPEEARDLMVQITGGTLTDAQIGAILTGLKMKGVTVCEITAFALVLQEHAIPVAADREEILVDTCGTGGDGARTFNISTAAALVAAASGVRVVKHGNRGVTSRSGSTDVLEALGIPYATTPAQATATITAHNIAFLFAPGFHPAMGNVSAARKEVGFFSVFNVLGPLLNPARAQARLIGVGDAQLIPSVTGALKNIGVSHAMVVHGDGTDEITITGPTSVSELCNGSVRTYTLTPEEFGITRASKERITGGDPAENAKIIHAILSGEEGPCRDIVLLNAGAAVYLGGKASCLHDGFRMAADAIDSGRAGRLLSDLRMAAA